jgi:hypothetical protein
MVTQAMDSGKREQSLQGGKDGLRDGGIRDGVRQYPFSCGLLI